MLALLVKTMFIEHIPHVENFRIQCSYNRRDISADAHQTGAIAYTVFVYGHIQGVGVTAYRIYNNVHIVKLKRWGQMLRIIGKSWKKQPK